MTMIGYQNKMIKEGDKEFTQKQKEASRLLDEMDKKAENGEDVSEEEMGAAFDAVFGAHETLQKNREYLQLNRRLAGTSDEEINQTAGFKFM